MMDLFLNDLLNTPCTPTQVFLITLADYSLRQVEVGWSFAWNYPTSPRLYGPIRLSVSEITPYLPYSALYLLTAILSVNVCTV